MRRESRTVYDIIQSMQSDLTRAERQLADTLIYGYPSAGLGSITELADRAGVSTPTVARMVQKIGFSGYPEFQAALRQEVQEMVSNPSRRRETWGQDIPETHILHRFAKAASDNIARTLDQVQPEEFDAVCRLMADPARRLHIAGGRLTGALAQYLFLHLQMLRPGVALVPSHANVWPHYMLDIQKGDVLMAFDVRRYENSTQLMAEMAHERGAEIVLFTDQWRSPIHRLARTTFAARIEVPSAWDSGLSTQLLTETLIAALQEINWETTKERTEHLEAAFDRSRLFRKFT